MKIKYWPAGRFICTGCQHEMADVPARTRDEGALRCLNQRCSQYNQVYVVRPLEIEATPQHDEVETGGGKG